jgi:hypothetical protein
MDDSAGWASIKEDFRTCVVKTIQRLKDSPRLHKPFHQALLSPEALFWSAFERSFSTSFGQGTIERISRTVALIGGATSATAQYVLEASPSRRQLQAINQIASRTPLGVGAAHDWSQDVKELLRASKSGKQYEESVIFDLHFERDEIEHFISIKTVQPNLDQTRAAKRSMLLATVTRPNAHAYFGLYYNPYGSERADYAHSIPFRVFDMHRDPCVLIGPEYWNFLGGTGTYQKVLNIAQEVGKETRKLIDEMKTEAAIRSV